MKIFDFDSAPARLIDQFGSTAANATPLTAPEGDAHVVCIRLGPGGLLGRHAAQSAQLFVVVQGEGWVSGADGEQQPVNAGTAAFWEAGEEHESGSDSGMTVIVVEAERLAPRL